MGKAAEGYGDPTSILVLLPLIALMSFAELSGEVELFFTLLSANS